MELLLHQLRDCIGVSGPGRRRRHSAGLGRDYFNAGHVCRLATQFLGSRTSGATTPGWQFHTRLSLLAAPGIAPGSGILFISLQPGAVLFSSGPGPGRRNGLGRRRAAPGRGRDRDCGRAGRARRRAAGQRAGRRAGPGLPGRRGMPQFGRRITPRRLPGLPPLSGIAIFGFRRCSISGVTAGPDSGAAFRSGLFTLRSACCITLIQRVRNNVNILLLHRYVQRKSSQINIRDQAIVTGWHRALIYYWAGAAALILTAALPFRLLIFPDPFYQSGIQFILA